MKAKFALALTLLFGVLVFTLQNTEAVDIRFFFWHLSLSRALLIFLVFGIGVLLGYLLATYRSAKGETVQNILPGPPGGVEG